MSPTAIVKCNSEQMAIGINLGPGCPHPQPARKERLFPPLPKRQRFPQAEYFMNFELPEEHQLAYESAFAFAHDEVRPHNDEIERSDDFPSWLWQRLAEQGYTGIAIPE